MTDSPKPPRSRSRSRSEVQSDFSSLSSPQKLSQKEREAKAARAGELRSSIADMTAEKAVQALASAGVAAQKSLSALSEEVTTKLAMLDTLTQNIEVEKEELTRLYGASTILEHLDVLMAQHDEKKAALELEISTARALWAEEKLNVSKDRQREIDDYNYHTLQVRKQEDDRWKEQLRLRNIEEENRQQQLEKGWTARTEALAVQEKELIDLRAQVAAFPAQLETEIKKQVSIVTSSLSRDHKHAVELLEKDRASEKALALSENSAKEQTIARLTKLNEELQAALTQANAKNVEIATKALDASSGNAALTAVQNFAKDQNLNGGAKRS